MTSVSAGCFGYLDPGTAISLVLFITGAGGDVVINSPLPDDAFFLVGCVPACLQMAAAPLDGAPALQLSSNLLTLYIGK